jgi:predicted GIY-YIG superfamily endonuclease
MTKPFMQYYTYVLKSEKNGDYYIGSTENVERRLELQIESDRSG